MTRNIPRWLVVTAFALVPSIALAATAAASSGWCPWGGCPACPF